MPPKGSSDDNNSDVLNKFKRSQSITDDSDNNYNDLAAADTMEVITAPLAPLHDEPITVAEQAQAKTIQEDPVLELKYRRRENGLPTTAVIPAVKDDEVVSEMQRLVSVFERDFLPIMWAMHAQARENDWTDDNGWYEGVRRITGGRFEIKVLGEFFTSLEGFEKLPYAMVEYAERQAKQDEKVQAMMEMPGGQLTFAGWSIILSQKCEAQTIHTDVPVNNVQFGLLMNGPSTGGKATPGTKVVLQEDFGPHSVEELVSGIWSDAPDSLRQCILETPPVYDWCNKVLNVFGPMLQRLDSLEANMAGAETLKRKNSSKAGEASETDGVLECGDLICTSGGIPHAGPKCGHFRMVMFGAASPTPDELYDVDDQFFAHSALLYIIQAAWDSLEGHDDAKWFLLQKLADIALDYDRSIADKHQYTSSLLTDFMNIVLDESEEGRNAEVVLYHFMRLHGSKPQTELFGYCPPALEAAIEEGC